MHTTRLSILTAVSLTFLLCVLSVRVSNPPVLLKTVQQQETVFVNGNVFANLAIAFKLIPGANNTWGYDILVDGRLKIHQPSIPGLPGNDGFKTRDGAEKVAKLVITKIETGEMPPTVTIEEMKNLGAR